MPKVNNGYQIDRDKTVNSGARATFVIDSLGWGTNPASDGAGPSYPLDALGDGDGSDNGFGTDNNQSWWKSGGDVTLTTGGDGTANPWWQLECTFAANEISVNPSDEIVLTEFGSSSGALDGKDPAGNDGTRLYTRTYMGPQAKSQRFSLIGRERVDF